MMEDEIMNWMNIKKTSPEPCYSSEEWISIDDPSNVVLENECMLKTLGLVDSNIEEVWEKKLNKQVNEKEIPKKANNEAQDKSSLKLTVREKFSEFLCGWCFRKRNKDCLNNSCVRIVVGNNITHCDTEVNTPAISPMDFCHLFIRHNESRNKTIHLEHKSFSPTAISDAAVFAEMFDEDGEDDGESEEEYESCKGAKKSEEDFELMGYDYK